MRNKIYFNLFLLSQFFISQHCFSQNISSVSPGYVSYANFIEFTINGDNTNFLSGVSDVTIINTGTGLEIPVFNGNVIYDIINDTLITGTIFPVCISNAVSAAYRVNTIAHGTMVYNITMYSLTSNENTTHNSCFQSNDASITVFGTQSPTKELLNFSWKKNGSPYFSETVDTLGYSTLNNLAIGNYEITIESSGCSVVESTTVVEPSEKTGVLLPSSNDTAYCFSNLPAFAINTNISGPFPLKYRINDDTISTNMESGSTNLLLDLSNIEMGYNEIEFLVATDLSNCDLRLSNALKKFTIMPESEMEMYGDATICDGDTALFFVGFEGEAIYDLHLTDGSNNFYFTELPDSNILSLSPNTTSTIEVVSFKDYNNPGCLGSSTDEVVITVSQIPTASLNITGSNPICTGDQSSIGFSVNASTNVDLLLTDGTVAFSYFNIFNGEERIVSPTEPITLSILSVTDRTSALCSSGAQAGEITFEVGGAQFAEISAPDDFCMGDTILLTFDLHGIGPFNVSYSDGNNDYEEFNVPDGYGATYVVTDTVTLFLMEVFDNGMPSCNKIASSEVTLNPSAAPNPILYGASAVCAEDTVRVIGKCEGYGPFNISYSYEGNDYETISDYSPFFLAAHPTMQGYIKVDNIVDLHNGCKSFTEDSLLLNVTAKPQPGLDGYEILCGNEVYDLFDVLIPPFDTIGYWMEVNTTGALRGSFIQPNQLAGGIYVFRYMVVGKYSCDDDSSTVTIEIVEAPKIINLNLDCEADLTAYKVEFDIEGNGASSFTINGSASGTLSPSPPYHFKSESIFSGEEYYFEVSNNLGCTTSISGIQKCDCENKAGRLLPKAYDYCEYDTLSAIVDIEPTVKAGDSLIYVIKKDASYDSLSYILSNNQPEFTYDPILTFDQTYYLATMVVPIVADTLNFEDYCLAVNEGIPFVFHESEKNLIGYLNLNGASLNKGEAYLHDVAIPKNYVNIKQDVFGNDSRFVMDNIDDGRYIVEVIPDKSNYPKALPLYLGNTPFWESAQVINKDCYLALENYNVTLSNLATLSGIGDISGNAQQLDVGGDFSLENQRILLIDDFTNEVIAFTHTFPSGDYFFSNIPEGTFRLKVEIAGLPHISTHKAVISSSVTSITSLHFDVERNVGIHIRGTSAVAELGLSNITIFPNPAKDLLHIKGLENNISTLSIYALTGAKLHATELSSENATIKLNHIPNGLYVVVLENNLETINWKLTIMR